MLVYCKPPGTTCVIRWQSVDKLSLMYSRKTALGNEVSKLEIFNGQIIVCGSGIYSIELLKNVLKEKRANISELFCMKKMKYNCNTL